MHSTGWLNKTLYKHCAPRCMAGKRPNHKEENFPKREACGRTMALMCKSANHKEEDFSEREACGRTTALIFTRLIE